MNKITKIIASLLASTALTFSAFAGEMNVTGTAKATYGTVSGQANGDNGVGVANELKFTAGGELDNGFTWDYALALDPASTAGGGSALNDDSKLVITTPYGAVAICMLDCSLGAAGAFNSNAYAWITDTGYGEGKVVPTNISSYNNIQYHTPSGLLPFDTTFKIAYAGTGNTLSQGTNSSTVANATVVASTTQYRISTVPVDGLAVDVSLTEQDGPNNPTLSLSDEQQHTSGTIAAKYTMGAFTVGLGRDFVSPRAADGTAAGATTVETYTNNNISIGFAVNDALSISFSDESSAQEMQTSTTVTQDQDTSSVQAAYTMGGMTLAVAHTQYDNVGYVANADVSETILAVTVGF